MSKQKLIGLLSVICLLFNLNIVNAEEWNFDSIQMASPGSMIADSSGENLYLSYYLNNVFWQVNQGEFIDLNDTNFQGYHYSIGYFHQNFGPEGGILLEAKSNSIMTDFYLKNPGNDQWEYLEEISGNVFKCYTNPEYPNTFVLLNRASLRVSFDGLESFITTQPEAYNQSLFPEFFHFQDELYCYFGYDNEDETHSRICKWSTELNDFDYDNPVFDTNGLIDGDTAGIVKVLPMGNGEILISLYGFYSTQYDTHFYIVDSDWDLVLSDYTDFFDGHIVRTIIETKDSPRVLYARDSRLYRSIDAGRTWAEYTADGLPQHVSFMNELYQQYQSGDLYLGINGSGVYKSIDRGNSWDIVDIPDFMGLFDLSVQNDCVGLSRTSYPWLIYRDGVWISSMIPSTEMETNHMNEIYYVNGDTLLGRVVVDHSPTIGTNESILAYTTNLGNDWNFIDGENLNTIQSFRTENGVRLVKSDEYDGPVTQVSYNMGLDWTPINVPGDRFEQSENYFYSVAYDDASTYFLRMPVFGTEWDTMDIDLEGRLPGGILPFGESLLLMKYNSDGIYSCFWYQDETWSQTGTFNSNEFYLPVVFEYADAVYVIFLNEEQELFISSDQLQTWEPLNLEFPFETETPIFYSFAYSEGLNQLLVSTEIGLFWAPVEQLLSVDEEPVQLQPLSPKLLTAYPNPFNASTRIQYHLTQPGNVKLDVYDITGRLVQTLRNTYQPAGRQNIFFDGSALASGTYFVQLTTNSGVRNKRISLIK